MLPLLLLILGFALGAALIVWAVTVLAERLTARLVNERFRAAEFIVNRQHVPQSWARATTKVQLLDRLDKLIAFFETCPFFENEESRVALLSQLRTERERWESAPMEVLVAPKPTDSTSR
ncbi:MAG: hypothetical protein IPK19_17185 [Chloroflexi bacterium]|nr:hypothetical protein [Chloroflexota bacterium]